MKKEEITKFIFDHYLGGYENVANTVSKDDSEDVQYKDEEIEEEIEKESSEVEDDSGSSKLKFGSNLSEKGFISSIKNKFSLFKNDSSEEGSEEISDVISGNAIGRGNDKERILAYNIGVSIHDINYAAHIYNIFEQTPEAFNHLMDAKLKDPSSKFWV